MPTCGGPGQLPSLPPFKSGPDAQFEDDTLGKIQPVKIVEEEVTKTAAVEFRIPVMTRAAAFKTRT